MAQPGAGKDDQWRGYMTVLVINHGIIQSITIPTAVFYPMIRIDVDTPPDCFWQEVKWTLASHCELSNPSGLDSGRVQHLPHALLQEKDSYCQPEGNQ